MPSSGQAIGTLFALPHFCDGTRFECRWHSIFYAEADMNRRELITHLMLSVMSFGMLAVVRPVAAADSDHHAHFMACAKACGSCQIECDMCFTHCKNLLAQGQKEHAVTTQLCVDCGDCCKLAASLTARMSPLSAEACDCCAKCCDKCAAECEKFKDDKHMAACAKSCRDCAKACRDMLLQLKP